MSKLIDVLDERGLRTGETLSRAEVHRLGKHHRAVHLYLFNSQDELLLQRRSLTVDHFPDVYSVSVLGHIDAGESSGATVRRELEEELGVDASSLQIDFLFSYFSEAIFNETYIDRQFNDIYMTRADLDVASLKFDHSEVSEVKFVKFEEFNEMVLSSTLAYVPTYVNEWRDVAYFVRGLRV